jgi:Zn finger protein HypA/HybF involved in hydrogenase expression
VPRAGRGPASYGAQVPCDYCGVEFDPIATRWLCPHCHMKANCCDGAPLEVCGVTQVPRDAVPGSSA